MNRTLKEATVNTYYYATRNELETHLEAFLYAYNFAKRLKALHGKTPWQFIIQEYKIRPELFKGFLTELNT